jgi:hypothetical protein
VRCTHTGALLRAPRYNASYAASAHSERSSAPSKPAAAAAAAARGTLFASAARGARCRSCRQFVAGASAGFVCARCAESATAAPTIRRRTLADARTYARDIEDLRVERAALAATCHDCMGCGASPQYITCENSDCPVFWKRRRNESSRRALVERMRTTHEAATLTGAFARLSLRSAPLELDFEQ